MNKEAAELLRTIGAMQTLVQMFPLALLKGYHVETIDSPIDLIVACLSTIGVTDKEIFSFLLTDVIGIDINLNDEAAINKWMKEFDDFDNEIRDNPFIQGLESGVKTVIAEILANIISCAIHPKIPDKAVNGHANMYLSYPTSLIDPQGMLDISPFSKYGRLLYDGIVPKDEDNPEDNSSTTPSSLADNAEDMNAFLWYVLYVADKQDVNEWKSRKTNRSENPVPIVRCKNNGFANGIEVLADASYYKKTLFRFNKDYLDSIKIFSPRIIIGYIIQRLVFGLPNAYLSIGMEEIMTQGMVDKIIKTVIDSDDDKDGVIINDCFYSFSNEEWDQMLEKNELSKYNAKSIDLTNDSITVINNKEDILDALNSQTALSTKFDQKTVIEKTIYDIAATGAVDTLIESKSTLNLAYNSQWLMDIIGTVINPIVYCMFSPKVMLLLVMNYDLVGVVNFNSIDLNDVGAIFELFKKKLIGILVRLINKIKDELIQKLLEFFYEKVLPLIALYISKKLLENMEYYLMVLKDALDCLLLFKFSRRGVPTQIDDVNYADIVPLQITPPNSIC